MVLTLSAFLLLAPVSPVVSQPAVPGQSSKAKADTTRSVRRPTRPTRPVPPPAPAVTSSSVRTPRGDRLDDWTGVISRLDSIRTQQRDLHKALDLLEAENDSLMKRLPEEGGARPYLSAEVDEPPERIRTMPLDLRRREDRPGKIVVNYDVNTLGRVEKIQVLGASKETKEHVVDVVGKWLYRPGIRNGKRVVVRMTTTL